MAPEARVYRSELIQPETVPQPGRTGAEVLAAFGIPQESIVLASFGFVAATKLNDVVCRAMDRLATCSSVPLYYLMVGEASLSIPISASESNLQGMLANRSSTSTSRMPIWS